jgi:acyl-CoA synthetase (AMP-forming)/AMP-acid ligase II
LENIQTHKVTYIHLVPPIILGLAKHPIVAKYDLSSVWAITSGAAPLGAEIQEEFGKKFPHIKVRQGYGMSETSPVTHACSWDNIVYGAAGSLFPNMEAKIVDPDTGASLGVGEGSYYRNYLTFFHACSFLIKIGTKQLASSG